MPQGTHVTVRPSLYANYSPFVLDPPCTYLSPLPGLKNRPLFPPLSCLCTFCLKLLVMPVMIPSCAIGPQTVHNYQGLPIPLSPTPAASLPLVPETLMLLTDLIASMMATPFDPLPVPSSALDLVDHTSSILPSLLPTCS